MQNSTDKSECFKQVFFLQFQVSPDDLILATCRKLDCQKEFEDFTDESRQLEQELETNLIQNEKQIRDLNGLINNLRDDNETLRVGKTSCLAFC